MPLEELVRVDGGARDGRGVVRVSPTIPLLSSQPLPGRISSTSVDMAQLLRLVWQNFTQSTILPKTLCVKKAISLEINDRSVRPIKALPKVSCDVSSHLSGRTKRTNPIWICIWFGDTQFAIFP